MRRHPDPLLQQLRTFAVDRASTPPTMEQWTHFLDLISHGESGGALEQALLEGFRTISNHEVREWTKRIEETQRIAGLGDWSFDRDLGLGKWSRECYRIFGLPTSAPIPTYKELSRMVHKDDRLYVKDRVDAALHDGRKFEIEFRYLTLTGGSRWLRAIGQPIKDDNGRVCRLLGTVMDVNERKLTELRQSLEHAVARLLAECDSPLEVMPEIIQIICETFGWICGALWTHDKKSSILQRTATWSASRLGSEQFFRKTAGTIPLPDHAVLGSRTLQLARNTPDGLDGFYSALTFPIQAAGEILGLMEFLNTQPGQIDKETLQSAHFIGRHIGQFFQRKQAEGALRESEAHFRALVEQASDSFYVHDVLGQFIDVNQQGCDSLGYSREELLKLAVQDVDIDMQTGDLIRLTEGVAIGTSIARESHYRRKDGSSFPVEIRIGPIEINGNRHLLSLVRDITERKQMQDHIQHLAYHDTLTELPNRAMFNRQLSHAISQARRNERKLAVLFIDLDRFKYVNDTLGHDAGDQLLKEMAKRLGHSLRGSDLVARLEDSKDMVARLGGDEFVVLLEDFDDSSHVAHVAHKLLKSLIEEYPLNGQILHMTGSIGVSIFPDDGGDEFTLMKHADIAMYRAKEQGKNNFQFYSAHMSEHAAKMLKLESSLRRALERDELVLYYQGKADTHTGRIIGAEALVRWRHPELGLLTPDHFITLAEETGLIEPLSQWVLREACSQNRRWQDQGLPALHMSVNLSARQFTNDHLINDTAQILRETDMAATLLELEITESMMMHNPDKTIQILFGLKAMGIRIAIDDFGIGYSSLSHLRQFPIDIIKIDRSFIQDVPGDPADEAITEAIIAMGKSLMITVVAEGVENPEQLEFLAQRSCEQIQGYFFSKPLPAEEFAGLLRENQQAHPTSGRLSGT